MIERDTVRNLRGLGAFGAAAIIAVLLMQAVVLIVLSVTSTPTPGSHAHTWRMEVRSIATIVDLLAVVVAVVIYIRVVRPMEGKWAKLVTELDALSRRMEAMAYVDPMTELPNRRYLMEHLRPAIARAERNGDSLAVYFIDLDGFKEINDTFGHEAGDAFLKAVAARLREVLREGDVLARIGGDEFLALQFDVPDDANVLPLGERLVAAASEPVTFEGRPVRAGASVGIARYPRDAVTAEALIDQADHAMYASKRAGKGRATVV
jgi:diguanylate cyclase (GGDEF)-like protein